MPFSLQCGKFIFILQVLTIYLHVLKMDQYGIGTVAQIWAMIPVIPMIPVLKVRSQQYKLENNMADKEDLNLDLICFAAKFDFPRK